MDSYLIVTHNDCNDGALAAALMVYILQRLYPKPSTVDCRVVPLDYSVKDIHGVLADNTLAHDMLRPRVDLIFVDYRVPAQQLEELRPKFRTVTVFDHHLVTEGDMVFEPTLNVPTSKPLSRSEFRKLLGKTYIQQDKCGAALVATLLSGICDIEPIERLVKTVDITDRYVKERMTDSVLAFRTYLEFALHRKWQAYYDFVGKLFAYPCTVEHRIDQYTQKGAMLLEYQRQLSDSIVRDMQTEVVLTPPGHDPIIVLGAWAPYVLASNIGHALANITADESYTGPCLRGVSVVICSDKKMSFRSVPGAEVTANALAQLFGGGGHEHASGCYVPAVRKLHMPL